MPKNKIFYIGGASGSGKSFSAQKLAKMYHLDNTELDVYYREYLIYNSEREAKRKIREFSAELIENSLRERKEGVIEGGWIKPQVAAKIKEQYSDTFFPVYVGYANDDPHNRFNMIKEGGIHWLPHDENPVEFITEQILGSQWYEQECVKYEIKYIDYSEPEKGFEVLKAHFDKIFKI